MRVIIQRVDQAAVIISGKKHASIEKGLLLLLGMETGDDLEDIDYLVNKIVQLRIFNDNENKMNLSLHDIDGDILLVSQFTLYASTKKGNRPSFSRAVKAEKAVPLYESFLEAMEKKTGKKVQTGVFGAMMKISLINEGPVTISMDSKQRE
jgi:D-aminoacyl-tRNA deacylase